MELSGQYLTYQEYRALGGTLDLTPFTLLEFESRRRIDIRTQNRLIDSKKIPQEVKICEFNMINSIYTYASSLSKVQDVASESTDGYSVSYITADKISEIIKSKNKELDDIIKIYLTDVIFNNEHLLYCGAR